MSYDLDFWKYENEPGEGQDHQAIYEKLSNGETVAGLAQLPIDQIMQQVADRFTQAGWEEVDAVSWEKDGSAFQLFTTKQFFRVDCYGMEGEDMNAFIDIAAEFGCPLYDPQVEERFTLD